MSKNEKNRNNKHQNSKNSLNENNNKEIEGDTNQEKKHNIFKVEKKDKDEKEIENIEVINLDSNNDPEELSESLQKLLLDENFASPVVVKKENKLITDNHYATFKNSYGENTCYINVILHLLYRMDELADFLLSLYQIDESTKKSENNSQKDKNENNNEEKEEEKESYDINEFLVSLGTIIDEYKKIISKENENNNNNNNKYKKKQKQKNKDKQVTVIKTLKMRKILEKISGNKFQLNTIADPVELLTFILDLLNEHLNGDTHKSFYLELIDEYKCETKNCNQINIKYDKDNFVYHIYIDEILKYIETEKIKVNAYKNQLFEFSYNSFILGNTKICEKCNSDMLHYLVCGNYPEYLLINCVWKESNPIVDDVMTILFLMSLKDDINNLFVYRNNNNKKFYYYLLGFILYSYTLSHYVIVKYEKNVFVLYDDEIVKEYNNINELINDITVEVLRKNGKAFFYPVMLIYTNEAIYKNPTINSNRLKDSEYQNLINKCNEAIYEYQQNNEIKDEMKSNNYEQLLKEQKEIENEINKRKISAERKANKSKNKNQDKTQQVDGEKEDSESNNEKKNEENLENIIIEDDDNKIEKNVPKKKEKSNKNSKSKEKDKIDSEIKKSKSKSKKKDKKEKVDDKKQKNTESNNINIQTINSNKKTKKKQKQNINEFIWNINDNKKDSESTQDAKKKQNNNSKNKYLGKKIYNSNEGKNEYYNNTNNYKSYRNKGKTFIQNSSRKYNI